MDERQEKIIKEQIGPISESLRKSFVQAVILRCRVAECIAMNEGAEPEDLAEIVAQTIESTIPITKRYLDELGDVKRASHLKGLIK